MIARGRTHLLWLLGGIALLGGAGALLAQLAPGERGVAPIDSSSNYEVTGIAVDVSGRTADQARTGGWREAQRRGWKTLWARLHGLPPDAAPGLPDATLDSIVSSIEVEDEQIGPTRYIAHLGVLFDRGRAAGFLGGTGGQAPHSQPMLVIPVEWSGGAGQSFERRTEWQRAWARFKAGASAVDYVRPTGSGADPLMLNAGQAARAGRIWWRMLLDQYGASDVVMPEVKLHRLYPGGPIRCDFAARHGPDGIALATFTLVAANPDQLDATLDEGVRRIDAAYVAALNAGGLEPDPSLSIDDEPEAPPPAVEQGAGGDDPLAEIMQNLNTSAYTVQADTPDAASVPALEASLRGLPGVHAAVVSSLAVGGVSVARVDFEGDLDALRLVLQSHGWQVDASGDALRIRRAPPAPPPPSPSAPPPQ